MEDLIQLVDVVSTFEEWTSSQQFRENTAYRPNIDYIM